MEEFNTRVKFSIQQSFNTTEVLLLENKKHKENLDTFWSLTEILFSNSLDEDIKSSLMANSRYLSIPSEIIVEICTKNHTVQEKLKLIDSNSIIKKGLKKVEGVSVKMEGQVLNLKGKIDLKGVDQEMPGFVKDKNASKESIEYIHHDIINESKKDIASNLKASPVKHSNKVDENSIVEVQKNKANELDKYKKTLLNIKKGVIEKVTQNQAQQDLAKRNNLALQNILNNQKQNGANLSQNTNNGINNVNNSPQQQQQNSLNNNINSNNNNMNSSNNMNNNNNSNNMNNSNNINDNNLNNHNLNNNNPTNNSPPNPFNSIHQNTNIPPINNNMHHNGITNSDNNSNEEDELEEVFLKIKERSKKTLNDIQKQNNNYLHSFLEGSKKSNFEIKSLDSIKNSAKEIFDKDFDLNEKEDETIKKVNNNTKPKDSKDEAASLKDLEKEYSNLKEEIFNHLF